MIIADKLFLLGEDNPPMCTSKTQGKYNMTNPKIVYSVKELRRAIESIDALAMQVSLVVGEIPPNADLFQDAQNTETLVAMFQENLLNKIELLEELIKNETRSERLSERYDRVA